MCSAVDIFEFIEVMRNADLELQLHKDTQEVRNDDYLGRRFLNLIQKCILEVIVEGNADKIVTERKRPKIASSMKYTSFQEGVPFLKLKRKYVEMTAQLPNHEMATAKMTRVIKTKRI